MQWVLLPEWWQSQQIVVLQSTVSVHDQQLPGLHAPV
jgi:hypothetical protein